MTDLQKRAIELVNARQGMKGVELSVKLASEFCVPTAKQMLDEIFSLIADGELVEVEYELPTQLNMRSYKTKSFILPKGTTVNINGKKK